MQKSEHINELAAALSKAQGMMEAAPKDGRNPHFKSNYSTLASCISAVREPFKANGLSFTQPSRKDEHGNVYVETVIMHSSGQWISGEMNARPTKNDVQGDGSVLSYLQRYGLKAMAGLSSEDDDGNAASVDPAKASGPVNIITYDANSREHKNLLTKIAAAQHIVEIEDLRFLSEYCKGKPLQDLDKLTKEWIKTQ
jgi:hypothetical protein